MTTPFALHRALSPLYTDRWTTLARTRLSPGGRRGIGRPVTAPALGVFGSGTGPVRVGGVVAAQPDGVTCAATGLLLLNAACDPALAAWLETGAVPVPLPPELADLAADELGAPDPRDRLAAAAAAVHRRATRATLGPLPWPRAIGTPPWGVAREARVPGVVYRHRPVDDTDEALMDEVLALLVAATTQGIPVPVYSGGDLARGWDTAMPRHLLLALPTTDPDRLRLYEPGGGRVHAIAPADLRARTTPHAALGGWTHLAWTLIPLVR